MAGAARSTPGGVEAVGGDSWKLRGEVRGGHLRVESLGFGGVGGGQLEVVLELLLEVLGA